jgi:hypothetical protein
MFVFVAVSRCVRLVGVDDDSRCVLFMAIVKIVCEAVMSLRLVHYSEHDIMLDV